MGCCGTNRKPFRTNGKLCPRCGWLMNRVHKYNSSTKKVEKYWMCTNKTRYAGVAGGPCGYREPIK